MIKAKEIFDFVFCCLSENKREQFEYGQDHNIPRLTYEAQDKLVRDKHGFRCVKCGKIYPYLRISYRSGLIDPQNYSKLTGNRYKCKKAAAVFCDRYYYAQNKNALLKVSAQ